MTVMNAVELSERLTSDPELVINVLIKLGFPEENIVYHNEKGLITSTRPDPDADNPHGFIMYLPSMRYLFTTRSGEGNLYQLVMQMQNKSFPEALELIGKWIGFKGSDIKIVRPFGGFYRNLIPDSDILDTDLNVYDESALPEPSGVSELFFKDGIDYRTQEIFGDRFDHDENAILIPIRNSNGELVGCKARNNVKNPDDGRRYWAKLPFQKTHVVYGLDKNYQDIIRKNTVVICESEKAVQQAYSFGCRLVVALMGHTISKTQARILKSLMVKRTVLALDEGLPEEEIRNEAMKLQIHQPLFRNQVSYIYGGMEPGSKNSPTDCGKDVFARLMKENLVRLDCGES